jgi:hypothetical protein
MEKQGTRHLPLIDSIPYIKDYLQDERPQAGNSNTLLFSAEAEKNFGKADHQNIYHYSYL